MITIKRTQNGLATLTVTILLLVAATGFTFYSAKSKVAHTRVASNDVKAKTAFFHAESGLDHAISIMNSDDWNQGSTTLTKEQIYSGGVGSAPTGMYKFTSTENTAKYSLVIEQLCVDCDSVKVTIQGKADAGRAISTISRMAYARTGVKDIEAPLLAAGSSMMVGSINVNSEGRSDDGNGVNDTVMTGGLAFDVGGSGTFKNGSAAAPPKKDIAALRGDNFYNYMGVEQEKYTEYKNLDSVVKISSCSSSSTAADGTVTYTDNLRNAIASAPTPKTVWVTGDCEIIPNQNVPDEIGTGATQASSDIGSLNEPITLIVQDGDITMSTTVIKDGNTVSAGTPDVNVGGVLFGLLYAFDTQNVNLNNAETPPVSQARLHVGFRGKILGAAILDYKYTFSYHSSLHVLYEKDMIKDRKTTGGGASAYWIPGSWSDI